MDKFKLFLGLEESSPIPTQPISSTKQPTRNQTISLAYFKKGLSEIKIIAPRKYSDALHISNLLKEESSMIINFEHLDKMNAKRFMDFISGTIYSLNGHMAKLSECLILLTPEKTLISEDDMPQGSGQEVRNNANEEIVVNLIHNN